MRGFYEGEQPASPQEASSANRGQRLGSWKAIAAYLKRSVRTVTRWEKEEGLPVHRHLHQKRGSVYAYKVEVDAWWTTRKTSLESQNRKDLARTRRARRWFVATAIVVAAAILASATHYAWRAPPRR